MGRASLVEWYGPYRSEIEASAKGVSVESPGRGRGYVKSRWRTYFSRVSSASRTGFWGVRVEWRSKGKLPAGYDVDHKDCNKRNNRPSNLRRVRHERHPLITFKGKTR